MLDGRIFDFHSVIPVPVAVGVLVDVEVGETGLCGRVVDVFTLVGD